MGIDVAVAHQASYYNPFLDIPVLLAGDPHPAWIALGVLGAVQGANVVPLYLIGAPACASKNTSWAQAGRWRCWARSARSPSPNSAPPITTM
jgi:hypothetical protein